MIKLHCVEKKPRSERSGQTRCTTTRGQVHLTVLYFSSAGSFIHRYIEYKTPASSSTVKRRLLKILHFGRVSKKEPHLTLTQCQSTSTDRMANNCRRIMNPEVFRVCEWFVKSQSHLWEVLQKARNEIQISEYTDSQKAYGLNSCHCCKQRIRWQTEGLKKTAFIWNRNITYSWIHSLVGSTLVDWIKRQKDKQTLNISLL